MLATIGRNEAAELLTAETGDNPVGIFHLPPVCEGEECTCGNCVEIVIETSDDVEPLDNSPVCECCDGNPVVHARNEAWRMVLEFSEYDAGQCITGDKWRMLSKEDKAAVQERIETRGLQLWFHRWQGGGAVVVPDTKAPIDFTPMRESEFEFSLNDARVRCSDDVSFTVQARDREQAQARFDAFWNDLFKLRLHLMNHGPKRGPAETPRQMTIAELVDAFMAAQTDLTATYPLVLSLMAAHFNTMAVGTFEAASFVKLYEALQQAQPEPKAQLVSVNLLMRCMKWGLVQRHVKQDHYKRLCKIVSQAQRVLSHGIKATRHLEILRSAG